MPELLMGRVLRFTDDPFATDPVAATRLDEGLVIDGGRIADVGPLDRLRRDWPGATERDLGHKIISPGFIDAHAHYPQTGIIASWGKRLIDWLNTYTFPEETRFADPEVCAEVSARHLDLVLDHGTTSVASFCTIHPQSVEAYFDAAEARGMALWAGKTCMDRNAPDGLRDTAQSAYDDSKALLERWHDRGRARYTITPRFSPTSTPEQLEALGALWAENPSCAMQTHLSEQTDEVAWVRDLFPSARDYLDTYEAAGLIGPGALFGHAIYLEPRERARLAESGAAVVHCPTSNTFIGSGLCDVSGLKAEGVTLGLATDTGGGSSFSMLRSMAAAYEVAQLRGTALHPAQLWWLATEGSAQALRARGDIGCIAPGAAADLVVIDTASTPAIAQRATRAEALWEELFPTIMMGDDRAVAQVWVGGTLLRDRG